MTHRLIAVANGRLLGEITRDSRGRLSFTYDAAWRSDDTAYPLSLSMPLTAPGHGHDRIEPWLWGLLPDNENVLVRWARRFQVSARSVSSLLSAWDNSALREHSRRPPCSSKATAGESLVA